MAPTQLKIYKGSEIRRFATDFAATSYSQLKEHIAQLYGLKADSILLSYVDSEGDLIGLSSDIELSAAVKHLGETNTWKLQLRVQQDQAQPKAPVEPEATRLNWHPLFINVTSRPCRSAPSLANILDDSLFSDVLDFNLFELLRRQHLPTHPSQCCKGTGKACQQDAQQTTGVDTKQTSDQAAQDGTTASGDASPPAGESEVKNTEVKTEATEPVQS